MSRPIYRQTDPIPKEYRTDRNNNPTAFTTELAKQAGLLAEIDYTEGDAFYKGPTRFQTAKLLKNPLLTTIHLIDKVGFYTKEGKLRWNYIGIPKQTWLALTMDAKIEVVHFMYQREGGTELENLFS